MFNSIKEILKIGSFHDFSNFWHQTFHLLISISKNHMEFQFLPLKAGTTSQILMELLLENCPSTNSRKYMGLPIRIITIMYGMRNAPPPFS